MQIYGLSSRYSAAIKKAKIIDRPELSALDAQRASGIRADDQTRYADVPKISRHGLSALLTPDDPSLHRQVAHQAGASYAHEARLQNRMRELRQTLLDIRSLQNMSTQLGPAVYA